MRCPYCSKEIEDGAAFCPNCGQAIQSDSEVDTATDRFWEIENEKKQREAVRVQGEIAAARAKSKSQFRAIIFSLIGLVCLGLIIYYAVVIVPKNQYTDAIELLNAGEYQAAYDIFYDLDDYEDSQTYIKQCEDGITENNYIDAVNTYNSGDYNAALNKFLSLDDYKDSSMYIANCEKIALTTAEVDDVVRFGPYDWLVLQKNGGDLLLISKNFVAEKIANEYTGYDKYGQYHCWSQSTLRDWLNGSFLTGNFSSEEIALLKKNTIITDEYSVDDYDGWNEEEIRVTTEDKVYIPSKADIEKYGIDPMPEKTSGNYYYNDDRNNAGWLRDRGHGIAFQCTYNSDGTYGSEWHHHSTYGVWAMIRVSID